MDTAMTIDQFDELVQEVVENLPPEFKSKLDNVAVVSEVWPSQSDLTSVHARPGVTLFGLYQGVPQPKRQNYSFVLPDKIKIFAGPILRASKNEQAARDQIRKTVLHEIGHHFGMSESEIRNAQD